MIRLGKISIGAIRVDGKEVVRMYNGTDLVFELSLSCFGSGFWNGSKPWLGSDGWKSNK